MWSENRNNHNGRSEEDMNQSIVGRIVADVIVFFICCLLIRSGVGAVLSVKVPLIIIAVIIGLTLIIYRIVKWRDRNDY